MKLSRMINILSSYIDHAGDMEIMFRYTDPLTKGLAIDPIDEMDLNIHTLPLGNILLFEPDQLSKEKFDPAVNDSIEDMEEEERAFPSDKE